ncbi:MAG TPA: histidine kinase dimerization/phospho-acceptor domain-containing protein [Thermoanaerobaculia bacterium]|nr:histidine kinase dimerization/phospho-acceptor domain-containing protein [Thermoanaerobaculia bacterium]
MRPFLLFRPGGGVPEAVRGPLERAGSDVLVAGTVDEALEMAAASQPEIVLVVPPGTVAEGAALLSRLPASGGSPPVFVLEEEGAHRAAALETIARGPWTRATAALGEASDDPAPALLLSRVQLTGLLDLWEQVAEGASGFTEHALRSLSLALDAARVTLYRWKAGSPHATVEGSSLGPGVVGRSVEIVRYPELRAAAARSGAVLVEEAERDPLMEEASAYFAGQRTRSLLCQLLPGDGSDLYLHAVRESVPFGLVEVALLAAGSRILKASLAVGRPAEPLEKGPDRKRLRTVQRILTGIPDATAMVGPSGEILLVNPPFCALTRRLESELVGLDVRSLLRPLAPEDAFTTLTPQPGSPVAIARARLVTAAGDTIPVEVLSLPTPDETAGKAGWSTVTLRDRRHQDAREAREQALLRDLDETSRQLDALQRSVREADVVRARFWTAAAHELRTPLAIAQSYLEVVLSDLAEDLPERPTQLLKTASDGLTRLERLISDVLDAAVTGRARSTLRLDELDLGEVVRGLAATLSATAFKRGVRLEVEVPKGLPRVAGDREKVERLVTNLVDHSLKRSPRGDSEVRIVASAADGRAFVKVVDRAPTLTPERAAHLYDDVGSARGGGEFGLSVARRLADAMGTELTAYCDADGANVKCVAWRLAAGEEPGPRG